VQQVRRKKEFSSAKWQTPLAMIMERRSMLSELASDHHKKKKDKDKKERKKEKSANTNESR